MDARIIARFWSNVDKSAGPEGCWPWTGHKVDGYGTIKVAGHTWRAHRVALAQSIGPIPEGMCACHRCDVRACVNPDHLFLGTNADNVADRVAKGRSAIQSGEVNNSARLSETMVREIRRMREAGVPGVEVARHFGIGASTVCRVFLRQNWGHVA